jgi:hypothetical protein
MSFLCKKLIYNFKDYPKLKDHIIKGFSINNNFRFVFVENTESLKNGMVILFRKNR